MKITRILFLIHFQATIYLLSKMSMSLFVFALYSFKTFICFPTFSWSLSMYHCLPIDEEEFDNLICYSPCTSCSFSIQA